MVRIPYIKIPSVRVRCIDPAPNIGTGGATPAPPPPITYLTQWKIVGNSEVHTLPYPDGIVLPNGYKRCEYLQSDGTAYIEIPLGFDKTDEVYAKVAMLDITHADKYFVAPKIWNDNSNRFGLGAHNIQIEGSYKNVFIMAYGSQGSGGGYLSPVILSDTEVREWEYKNYICSIGGSTKDNSNLSFGSETANLRLFYGYNSATKCQICEYKHKKGNTEYRFIPCLDNNDIPCMYDVINNQTYYNSAGSGSFTYELYPQPTEIWSCGEYSAVDGKYHILVQPQGGSIADIALTEPLRKVNDVADTIEFPSDTEGKALVTRNIGLALFKNMTFVAASGSGGKYRWQSYYIRYLAVLPEDNYTLGYLMCNLYSLGTGNDTYGGNNNCIALERSGIVTIYDSNYDRSDGKNDLLEHIKDGGVLYAKITPTTELVDAPQIEEADSYTCVISQGGKAISWSSFTTDSE